MGKEKGEVMEPKALIKSLLILSISVGVILLSYYQFFLPRRSSSSAISDESFGWKIPKEVLQQSGQVVDSDAYSKLRATGGIAKGLPVRLKIPVIGVDTLIEDAYITPDGRMDVPAGSRNVAWYALGQRPGQIGNAVVGGHFGIDNGIPKVFYNLDKLKPGDKAYVVDDQNNTLAFEVRSIRLFDRNADATSVFTSNDNLAHLNIITCEGVWNKIDDSYPDRRVVFAVAIPSEGAVTVRPINQVAINPSLPQTAITPELILPTEVLIVSPTLAATVATVASAPEETLLSTVMGNNTYIIYGIIALVTILFIYININIQERK